MYNDEECFYEFKGANGTVNYTDIEISKIENVRKLELALDCILKIEVLPDWMVRIFDHSYLEQWFSTFITVDQGTVINLKKS